MNTLKALLCRRSIALTCALLGYAFSAGAGCAPAGKPPASDKGEVTNVKIEDVLHRHEQQLMAIPGVTAVGIGEQNGQPVIKIMIKQRTEELNKKLPRQLEGFNVQVEVSGEIRAF